MNFAGNRATITESTGTLAKTPKPPPTIFIGISFFNRTHRRASIERNRDLIQAQAHNRHNEPVTHLEHSRGNQTTPTQSSDTLASDHHRRRTEWLGIERSQHHQSFIAGYERWIVPPKGARITRSKAGYTSSRGPPCTRIDNVYSVGEPPRLSISQKISEKEERERIQTAQPTTILARQCATMTRSNGGDGHIFNRINLISTICYSDHSGSSSTD
ncbi:hypothetical protein YC2023_100083 [Brassica napus]